MRFSFFSRRGPLDFVIQRVSALVIALYTFCLVGFIFANPAMTYQEWVNFINSTIMMVFGVITILSVLAHSWIGLWIVGTDYLSEHSLGGTRIGMRYMYQTVVILILAGYALWGSAIVIYGEVPF